MTHAGFDAGEARERLTELRSRYIRDGEWRKATDEYEYHLLVAQTSEVARMDTGEIEATVDSDARTLTGINIPEDGTRRTFANWSLMVPGYQINEVEKEWSSADGGWMDIR
jgi:hypothetical protein